MKKLLIASTALVMVAGAAAAEVKLSGDARMGMAFDGDNWNFSNRARVTFTLSGTTDSGLEFGASFRADNSGSSLVETGADNGDAGSVYISGAFGKLTMGNVASAPEALFGDLAEVGYLGDDQSSADDAAGHGAAINALRANGIGTNDIPYLTLDNDTQSALQYTYTAGALSVAAALTDGQINGTFDVPGTAIDESEEDRAYSVAAAYTFGNYVVGLGYEKIDGVLPNTDESQVELAGIAKFGNTDVKAYYADGGDENPVEKAYGLSVASVFGATTVSGYVQKVSLTDAATTAVGLGDATWYGLGASYDLGGGAAIAGAIQDNNMDGTDPTANVGVTFKF